MSAHLATIGGNIIENAGGPHALKYGVTYNHVLVPGTPTEGITLDIYNASKEAGGAKVSKHMILFEPTTDQIVVNEAFIVSNTGKTAWNDPGDGTLHFYVPPTVQGGVQVSATPPGGLEGDLKKVLDKYEKKAEKDKGKRKSA